MLRIGLAQINAHLGNIAANTEKLLQCYHHSCSIKDDLLFFPELALVGYPPYDYLGRPALQSQVKHALERLAAATIHQSTVMMVGAPWWHEGGCYNAVYHVASGKVFPFTAKRALPNYRVFDDKRYFTPFNEYPVFTTAQGVRIGIAVCEDVWDGPTMKELASRHSDILLAINASPFERDKAVRRFAVMENHARTHQLPCIYLNTIGGQDGIIFDGGSFFSSADGNSTLILPHFVEGQTSLLFQATMLQPTHPTAYELPCEEELLYCAIMLGLKEYVYKSGAESVILGLSGGIDSALVAALATDALGKEAVNTVMLPSEYTALQSITDAEQCATALGIRHHVLLLEKALHGIELTLQPFFAGLARDTTEENLQARLRGMLLMALSNKSGALLLTTGNKSELAVGYATLYGDMCGAYNPLKDLYKTQVYKLAHWRNHHVPKGAKGPAGQVIPDSILTKAPTAELRPHQTDQDTLPPYEELDALLFHFIEEQGSIESAIGKGFAEKTVEKIAKMLYGAEFKRYQAPPGPKLSAMAFERDWRYPLTNGFTMRES